MPPTEEFLVQKRRNIVQLIEQLAERLQTNGFIDPANVMRRCNDSIGALGDEAVLDVVRRAVIYIWLAVYPPGLSKGCSITDAPFPDIRDHVFAIDQALGNLKVYFRYGMRRPDVSPAVFAGKERLLY